MKEFLLILLVVVVIISGISLVASGTSTPHCVQTATGNTNCSNSPSGGYGPDGRPDVPDVHEP